MVFPNYSQFQSYFLEAYRPTVYKTGANALAMHHIDAVR